MLPYGVLIVPMKQGMSTYNRELVSHDDVARLLKRKRTDTTSKETLAMSPCKKGIYVCK